MALYVNTWILLYGLCLLEEDGCFQKFSMHRVVSKKSNKIPNRYRVLIFYVLWSDCHQNMFSENHKVRLKQFYARLLILRFCFAKKGERFPIMENEKLSIPKGNSLPSNQYYSIKFIDTEEAAYMWMRYITFYLSKNMIHITKEHFFWVLLGNAKWHQKFARFRPT